MARRRNSSSTRQPGRVAAEASHRWPNLQDLIDSGGTINIGQIAPLDTPTAVAAQGRRVYAMLRVGDDESLPAMLDRLDGAVEKAMNDGVVTDEINR